MRTVQTFIISLLLCLAGNTLVGQNHEFTGNKYLIYELESRLMKGDKAALFEIAPYFDSKKKVMENLGYHRLETSESDIAKRVVAENILFTKEEFIITDSSTSQQFTDFLTKNNDKIIFSELAAAFLITPLNKRAVIFETRAISDTKKQELKNNAKVLLSPEWVKQRKIDLFVKGKEPFSLLLIASELFKARNRFDRYYFHNDEFTNLIQYLTETEIGVNDEKGTISWHIDKDYNPESKLNLLIYFSKFYTQYVWDEKKSVFVNPNLVIKQIGKEDELFSLLSNETDSIALDAFTQLTVCNPEKVTQLADEYEKADIQKSYAIPIFPYRFLKQLVLLTTYCKTNNIDFIGTKELQNNISILRSNLSFQERRKLEDKLISTLTLDEVTALEYWALIHEQSWGLTYSAGRILDIFYSNHFPQILGNDQQLSLFLKKSLLFNNLGIIGVCNNYLVKFTNLQEYGIEKLNRLQSSDTEIKTETENAKTICKQPLKAPNDTMKINDGNNDFVVENLRPQITRIKKIKDQEQMEDSLTELLSKISYSQIGEAIKAIESIKYKEQKWEKYSFLESDFGFFIYNNFDIVKTRQEFIADYNKFSEFDFYKNMLSKTATNYFNNDNSLNYDKIFDALKYNVVVAFAGGGGGRDDNEVYAIIKLLELTHKTTLGYPKKLCNSNGIWGCNSQDRADYWMQYISENKLLKNTDNKPVSFHYEREAVATTSTAELIQ